MQVVVISRYQSILAWEQVKAIEEKNIQMVFAFIKATEGIDNTGVQFKRSWKKIVKFPYWWHIILLPR